MKCLLVSTTNWISTPAVIILRVHEDIFYACKMLSSGAGNQYLRPEYLTPLPTTLDAKKSPLALLAQTCSQIGADSPNTKLLQSSEKSKSKSESSREKSSPIAHSNDISLKSSFKPYEPTASRDKTGSPEDRSSNSSAGSRVRTPVAKSSSTPLTNGIRCSSSQSSVSPRASPSTESRKTPASEHSKNNESHLPSRSSEASSSSGATTVTTSSSASKTSPTPSVLTSSSADPALKDLPLGTFKPSSIPVSTSAYLNAHYANSGMALPMDLMASSIMSHHALKSGALSPYLSYARMKNPGGGDSLVPVCRDPYCTGCGLNSHLLGNANGQKSASTTTCPAGCAQCDHAAGKPPSYLGHSPAAAAYAHAQLAALAAATQLPYVCNWIAGDAAYCGKRFGTSEELLQHLRTHTSLASVSESNVAALSMLPATHPLLHRTYPTPPLSPLATARYHPYSKPSLLPPSLAASSLASFPLGHPSLSPYFSPYSLYGPRLGASHP